MKKVRFNFCPITKRLSWI